MVGPGCDMMNKACHPALSNMQETILNSFLVQRAEGQPLLAEKGVYLQPEEELWKFIQNAAL